jgi:hypothetical protein
MISNPVIKGKDWQKESEIDWQGNYYLSKLVGLQIQFL